jgi:putative SOS response-associated peptidase YedK
VDGFYEHQHHGRKTYPYFIYRKDSIPLIFACLYSLSDNPVNQSQEVSFSIVTTGANELMTQIHNNPRAEGPRMPLILTESECDLWLKPSNSRLREELTVLMRPYPEEELTAHTVARLKGKEALGNVPEVAQPYFYRDLEGAQAQNTLDFEGF